MVTYKIHYSCWRLSRYDFLVIASCSSPVVVRALHMQHDGTIREYNVTVPLPDMRLQYPCTFSSLPADCRAMVRGFMTNVVEDALARDNYELPNRFGIPLS
jgi:hypothetical protein